ncbi:E2f transcription factor-like e2fe [Thalictrum thalictroides]|uniref:E2f transcription factor-like e2fe n=1 Tax=Thalictrum thalictroides TaxID=46969 RepID=A0A7J6X1N9_THATH|nr:E2f transcription factor-like e2fe [Thalictrum thalictroides]
MEEGLIENKALMFSSLHQETSFTRDSLSLKQFSARKDEEVEEDQEDVSLMNLKTDNGRRHYSYSRKQKSLGLLCTNFLSLYNRDGIDTIGLDDAASKLGVERRRIYDIVNVLESVGLLTRKAKNRYSWIGFGGIPNALNELKEEGLLENNSYNASDVTNQTIYLDGEENGRSGSFNSNSSSEQNRYNPSTVYPKLFLPSKVDNRREKSLGLLTQNFVKLFICRESNLVSLDEAAKFLLGETHHSCQMRTKVRRLYDIANVLSSLNLIEKTHHAETRKPAFRWLGLDGTVGHEPLDPMESKKRVFGTDVTNTSYKRNKIDFTSDANVDQKMKVHMKCEDLTDVDYPNWMPRKHQPSKQNPKGVVFGPFRPVELPKVGENEKKNVKKVQDWETLASSYRPQYHNQGIILLLKFNKLLTLSAYLYIVLQHCNTVQLNMRLAKIIDSIAIAVAPVGWCEPVRPLPYSSKLTPCYVVFIQLADLQSRSASVKKG